ncbi:MAG: ABC transporter ATP-binding protein [Bdellovibrionales bacterium]|nr:ABC transporter ATP-binding protein [Bdellovibrionales bacterium]
MLELGAGFHPELSGHENVLLNAAILGFSRAEALEKMDQIIEFSELGDLIGMQVQNYSSGMLMRLGFSIAAHLNSEILLFDEVLAVGDAGFQRKCLTKIGELHEKGVTVVLVTHSPDQVRGHCNRCIVFDSTKVVYEGEPTRGCEVYLSTVI